MKKYLFTCSYFCWIYTNFKAFSRSIFFVFLKCILFFRTRILSCKHISNQLWIDMWKLFEQIFYRHIQRYILNFSEIFIRKLLIFFISFFYELLKCVRSFAHRHIIGQFFYSYQAEYFTIVFDNLFDEFFISIGKSISFFLEKTFF